MEQKENLCLNSCWGLALHTHSARQFPRFNAGKVSHPLISPALGCLFQLLTLLRMEFLLIPSLTSLSWFSLFLPHPWGFLSSLWAPDQEHSFSSWEEQIQGGNLTPNPLFSPLICFSSHFSLRYFDWNPFKDFHPKSRFCSGSGWRLHWINQSQQQRRVSHYFRTNRLWIDTNNFTSIQTHPHVNHEWRNTFGKKKLWENSRCHLTWDDSVLSELFSALLSHHFCRWWDSIYHPLPSWNPRDTDPSLLSESVYLFWEHPSLKFSFGRGS